MIALISKKPVLCSFLFFIFFAAIAISLFKIETLNGVGGFVGGILGPVFSLITILILLKDREESEKRNSIDSALKIYEHMLKSFKSRESKLFHTGWNLRQEPIQLKGFAVLNYFNDHFYESGPDEDEELEVYKWVLEYSERLVDLYDLMKIRKDLKDMMFFELKNEFQQIKEFSYKFYNEFKDNPRVNKELTDIVFKMHANVEKLQN